MNAPFKPPLTQENAPLAAHDAPAATTPEKEVTRRGFLEKSGRAAIGTAIAAAVGYPTYEYLKPKAYDLALLKMDTALNGLALEHRRCSTGDREASVEPAKESFEGIDPRTLAADGHESLVISPELSIAAQDSSAQNIDRHAAKLTNCPKNIYLPYHLFADARSFDLRVKKNGAGQWRLCLDIVGVPQAARVPILKAIPHAVAGAVEDAGNGIGNNFSRGIAWIEDRVGLGGSADHLATVAGQQQEAANTGAQGRPHPSSEAIFSLEMDFIPGRVPNLLFFNGRTLDNPTYSLRGSRIEEGIRTDPDFHFPLIPNEGLNYTNGVGQNGIGVPVYRYPYRFFDQELATKVENTRLLADSTPTEGYLPEILHYLGRKALHDTKLDGYEMGALAIAARCQQHALDEQGFLKKFAITNGFAEQEMKRAVPSEMPGTPSR